MSDIIRLLPDNIANQIAAGEVIQRPASVVKELLENALDAGATQITLLIKDAGKTLIHVIDNGKGMTATDARLSFERHATSKISTTEDLFAIRTMGFRGEALASIAAIAQVNLKTKRKEDSIGTHLSIAASAVEKQAPCASTDGSQIEVKNLFYNVPARRKFLKSDSVEMRYILDEFYRIALANPGIALKLVNNDKEQFNLPKANLKQRIVSVLGNKTNENWIKLEESLDTITLSGFVGKPEAARKSKADQYFFVNGRFIKSGYLHHAVMNAYQELIQEKMHPSYVIFMNIDPSSIDINVHPTKQEIKFDDEKLIYSYLRVAVRHALGQYALTPMLDFDQEQVVSGWLEKPAIKNVPQNDGVITKSSKLNQSNFIPGFQKESVPSNWRDLYESTNEDFSGGTNGSKNNQDDFSRQPAETANLFVNDKNKRPYQLHNQYIVNQIKSGFIIVDQQRAHQRILFERFSEKLKNPTKSTQPLLFAEKLELNTKDAMLLEDLYDFLTDIGFDIHSLGHNTYMLYGVPSMMSKQSSYSVLVEEILNGFNEYEDLKMGNLERIALSMARSASIRKGDELSPEEMNALIDQLFACEMPYSTPTGKNCFITFELDQLNQQFR